MAWAPIVALMWGLISAASLPLGALVSLAPFIPDASEQLIGLFMAFGGGSLLFAVSVEMFAHALQELGEEHGQTLMTITIICSVLGALLYIFLNRILRCVSLRSPAPRVGPEFASWPSSLTEIPIRVFIILAKSVGQPCEIYANDSNGSKITVQIGDL